MTAASRLARLAEREVPEAGGVLARAFFDDPLFVFIEPDDELRGRMLPWVMTQQTTYYRQVGEVYRTPGRLEAVALWRLMGQEGEEERGTPTWRDEMPDRLGEAAYERFIQATAPLSDLQERDMPMPHWYLSIIGVDPPCHGRGAGSGLIAPILDRADRDRVPCYLVTHKERNLSFYAKHGYRVLVEDEIPGGGLRYWTMKREPRSRELG